MKSYFKNNGIKNYDRSWKNDILNKIKTIKNKINTIRNNTKLLADINNKLELINDKLPQLGANEINNSIPVNIASNQIVSVNIDKNSKLKDLFDRINIVNPVIIFNNSLVTDITDELIWDDVQVSGGGTTSTYDYNTASVTLEVSNITAGRRVRQTFVRFLSIPGNDQMIMMGGIFGNQQNGITKYIGYMDNNNGLFFSVNSTTINVGIRTFTSGVAVDTLIPQSEWNLDTMDGNGPSGIILDLTKMNCYIMKYQIVGGGRIKWGLYMNNDIYYVHQISTNNTNSVVYIQNCRLPLRYEIVNDGTGDISNLTQYATYIINGNKIINEKNNVMFNGLYNVVRYIELNSGIRRSLTANNQLDMSASNINPICAIRLKSSELSSYIIINKITISIRRGPTIKLVAGSVVPCIWQIITNATLSNNITYTDVTNSAIQTNAISLDSILILNNNYITLDSGLVFCKTGSADIDNAATIIHTNMNILLGADYNNTRREYILMISRINIATGRTIYNAAVE